MDAMKIANSIPMWLACALPVAFVILQAVLFARGAYKSGKKLGLNDKQMKKAMKSSAVTSIGPSIVVLSAMLSLLVSVGGPIGWMRLSMIGSVMFESIAAGLGTSAVGVQLGTDTLTPEALGMAVWTMILYSSTCISCCLWNLTKTSCIINRIYQRSQCLWSVMVCRTDLLLSSRRSCWNLYGILIRKYL